MDTEGEKTMNHEGHEGVPKVFIAWVPIVIGPSW